MSWKFVHSSQKKGSIKTKEIDKHSGGNSSLGSVFVCFLVLSLFSCFPLQVFENVILFHWLTQLHNINFRKTYNYIVLTMKTITIIVIIIIITIMMIIIKLTRKGHNIKWRKHIEMKNRHLHQYNRVIWFLHEVYFNKPKTKGLYLSCFKCLLPPFNPSTLKTSYNFLLKLAQ